MASPDSISRAEALRARVTGSSLPAPVAKLFSHHARVRVGRPGLPSWSRQEADSRLDEAILLIDAGLLLRAEGRTGFRPCLLRAAELLEWLTPSGDADADASFFLTSAAAYQLAGYPARAHALLKTPFPTERYSNILRSFLRGMFQDALDGIRANWSQSPSPAAARLSSYEDVDRIVREATLSAFGITIAYARWGETDRLNAAIEKLDAVRQVLVRDGDKYSWLLAKLTAAYTQEFVATSLRRLLEGWADRLTDDGRQAVERYVRDAYLAGKSQAWPSQRVGINRLQQGGSFALCTPTGSGKTRVAELAILQALFALTQDDGPPATEPVVIYLVPSRALAAEVEFKLARVFKRLAARRVIVTGLYGGTDWGPADAWLTSTDPTVLICTYEKGEALMRFVGPLFLHRVRLVILDEAHSVRFGGKVEELRTANSRAFRLESLGMRLIDLLARNKARIIALSAVATGIELPLNAWVTGDADSRPVTTNYRSTRQLIGRLLLRDGGRFETQYDLLDRAPLQVGNSGESPYVPAPVPACPSAPPWEKGGPLKSLRPAAVWAAMHLTRDATGVPRGVLVSLTDQPDGFGKDCVELLTKTWAKVKLPDYFSPPQRADLIDLYDRCKTACQDVFGADSSEYRLLGLGIVLHHGKMPPTLGRLMVSLVENHVINLVIATSTLSEGINLPLETVLVPSLARGQSEISASEFANLAGRAGRPGVSSEGQTLVLIKPQRGVKSRNEKIYEKLIGSMQDAPRKSGRVSQQPSPLGALLQYLWEQWRLSSGSDSASAFHHWLEMTSPEAHGRGDRAAIDTAAVDALDTLDSLLLSVVVEYEAEGEQPSVGSEDFLQRLWGHSFASRVNTPTALRDAFLRRGRAIGRTVFTDPVRRRSLYRTGLPPRSAAELLDLYPAIRHAAVPGRGYASWDRSRRLEYVTTLVGLIGRIKRFQYKDKIGPRPVLWQQVLAWWLDPSGRPHDPGPASRPDWYKYVNTHFVYLFGWGIGSVIGVATAEAGGHPQSSLKLEDWPTTGLPWALFWLKDLVTWGTTDPVAAYLLAKGHLPSRLTAEAVGAEYYKTLVAGATADPLDPRSIRRWVESRFNPFPLDARGSSVTRHRAEPVEDLSDEEQTRWRVLPVLEDGVTHWIDVAGYEMARSLDEVELPEEDARELDFVFDSKRGRVEVSRYL